MTPSGYTLFLRDETLVLRALSDDANDGFFNIDRVPNTPHAIEHLRQYGMALARQAKVPFTDFTQTTPSPPTKSVPKKPRKLICLSTTCRAVRHRATKCGFTLKSRDNAYRLMVGTDLILAGTLECISAYLAVQDVPSKPTPAAHSEHHLRRYRKTSQTPSLYRAQNQVGLHDDAREYGSCGGQID